MGITRRQFTIGSLISAATLSGCQGSTSEILALREHAPLPKDALNIMRSKGMTPYSPIMMRIFKQDEMLEVWKQMDTGRFEMVKEYPICAFSGAIGPKFKEGDRQAPEGFYHVGRSQMNPRSSYHLSFNLGFPNAFDRAHGRTGSHLMVHGDCSSAGCYAMTDEGVAEIYAFARDALRGGRQDAFQVQAFPFRMTAENMARHVDHKHFKFWDMIREGHDHFELTKVPPKVDVCGKRYVFNRTMDSDPVASRACPDMTMSDNLKAAYDRMQSDYKIAFDAEIARLQGVEATVAPPPEPATAAPAEPTATPVAAEASANGPQADFPPFPGENESALPLPNARP